MVSTSPHIASLIVEMGNLTKIPLFKFIQIVVSLFSVVFLSNKIVAKKKAKSSPLDGSLAKKIKLQWVQKEFNKLEEQLGNVETKNPTKQLEMVSSDYRISHDHSWKQELHYSRAQYVPTNPKLDAAKQKLRNEANKAHIALYETMKQLKLLRIKGQRLQNLV